MSKGTQHVSSCQPERGSPFPTCRRIELEHAFAGHESGGSGRSLFVVGAAAETARLAGLPVDRIRNLGANIQQLIHGAIILIVISLYGRRRTV